MIHGRIVKRTRNGFYTEMCVPLRVYFARVPSERFEKTAQELLSYQIPITKIIEDNSVKEAQIDR